MRLYVKMISKKPQIHNFFWHVLDTETTLQVIISVLLLMLNKTSIMIYNQW